MFVFWRWGQLGCYLDFLCLDTQQKEIMRRCSSLQYPHSQEARSQSALSVHVNEHDFLPALLHSPQPA